MRDVSGRIIFFTVHISILHSSATSSSFTAISVSSIAPTCSALRLLVYFALFSGGQRPLVMHDRNGFVCAHGRLVCGESFFEHRDDGVCTQYEPRPWTRRLFFTGMGQRSHSWQQNCRQGCSNLFRVRGVSKMCGFFVGDSFNIFSRLLSEADTSERGHTLSAAVQTAVFRFRRRLPPPTSPTIGQRNECVCCRIDWLKE